jgi:hypothetical protein
MSVSTRVCTKPPLATGPLWATRSASTNPGGGSSQPSNVLTGTLRLIATEGADRRRVAVPACRRISRNARSIVTALIAVCWCAPPAPAADGRVAPWPRLGLAAVRRNRRCAARQRRAAQRGGLSRLAAFQPTWLCAARSEPRAGFGPRPRCRPLLLRAQMSYTTAGPIAADLSSRPGSSFCPCLTRELLPVEPDVFHARAV